MTLGGVPFDMFVAEVAARNMALNTDAWKSFEDVPEAVFDNLIKQPKVTNNLVKKFGVKAPAK